MPKEWTWSRKKATATNPDPCPSPDSPTGAHYSIYDSPPRQHSRCKYCGVEKDTPMLQFEEGFTRDAPTKAPVFVPKGDRDPKHACTRLLREMQPGETQAIPHSDVICNKGVKREHQTSHSGCVLLRAARKLEKLHSRQYIFTDHLDGFATVERVR